MEPRKLPLNVPVLIDWVERRLWNTGVVAGPVSLRNQVTELMPFFMLSG